MNSSLSAIELRAALTLSLVFFLRMLPLFMLLPVLALATDAYTNATPQLLGVGLGIYGLTQAGLQIPFGMLSDYHGRKKIIVAGLVIFILGSVMAAVSDSIYGLIAGRALQGAGAVAAAIMALAADLTREQTRTAVMALIGISIGLSFSLAFILGPYLYTYIDLDGLFYLGAVLGLCAILVLWFTVPAPVNNDATDSRRIELKDLKAVMCTAELLRLDFSIFISHAILMANFVVIPVTLRDLAGLNTGAHWQIYLAVIVLSVFIFIPFIIFSEKLNKIKLFFLVSVFLIAVSQTGLFFFHTDISHIIIALVIFFGAFNYLEAFLPAAVSKRVESNKRGTALGVYSTAQFLGMFIGGLTGGFIYQNWGNANVHLFCLISTGLWFILITLCSEKTPLTRLTGKLEEDAV